MPRRRHAIPLQQAALESPSLASLMNRVHASTERLNVIRSLLPTALRPNVQAGPLDEGCWCLMVQSNAVAAKLRQMVPALLAHLNTRGLGVISIRIKVQNR